jgi:hypothetical protein
MSETPVHKDNRLSCRENQIRLSRQFLDISALRVILENQYITKGGYAMIQWETELKKAVERATVEKKTILLDFFNPG